MTTLEKLADTIREIVRKDLPTDPDALACLSLTDDLDIDSLDFINFLFRIEQMFEIKIPEEDIDAKGLVVLGPLAKYIEEHLGN